MQVSKMETSSDYSRERIEKGSKSFAAAARLFDPDTRAHAYMLYAWCRHCDDVIDGQELVFARRSGGADRRVPAWRNCAKKRGRGARRVGRDGFRRSPPRGQRARICRSVTCSIISTASPWMSPAVAIETLDDTLSILLSRGGRGRGDDGDYHGRARRGDARPRLRSRHRVSAHQHHPRCDGRRRDRAHLSARGLACAKPAFAPALSPIRPTARPFTTYPSACLPSAIASMCRRGTASRRCRSARPGRLRRRVSFIAISADWCVATVRRRGTSVRGSAARASSTAIARSLATIARSHAHGRLVAIPSRHGLWTRPHNAGPLESGFTLCG